MAIPHFVWKLIRNADFQDAFPIDGAGIGADVTSDPNIAAYTDPNFAGGGAFSNPSMFDPGTFAPTGGSGWLNNAANSFFGGAGMDPATGLPYQMSPQTAQSFYTGNQLGPDQAGDSTDQTTQGQPASQQRQAQQQQPPPWYQQMANQFRAGPGFTAIGGERPPNFNERFQNFSSPAAPPAGANISQGVWNNLDPGERQSVIQKMNQGEWFGGDLSVPAPSAAPAAPPAAATPLPQPHPAAADVLPTPDSPGAVPGTNQDRPGTPSPRTAPGGQDSGDVGGWRDYPGGQQPGGGPGGQQQGGGGWLGQMLRNLGLPGPLAAMAAQALLGGMMGGMPGRGGFPGRFPLRGGFPGMRGGRFGGMRGMPFRGGFPFRGMRGGYPRFQRGGFQGPGGFPFTGGDQQPDQQQSDQQQPDQTQAPGQTAATPSQVDENERIAAGQPLTPAEQAAGGQAPGTPQEAQSAAIGGAGGGNIPERVLAGARQAAMLGGPGAVARWMAQNGHPRSGPWCGEFAAALMRSQNLPVPRNPAIASNWRNWGRPVRYPRPGDIAVRMGPPTGATGSHVTVVRRLSPDGRMMLTTGGNQGALTGWRSTRGYQFRTMGDTTPGVNDNATLFAHGLMGG